MSDKKWPNPSDQAAMHRLYPILERRIGMRAGFIIDVLSENRDDVLQLLGLEHCAQAAVVTPPDHWTGPVWRERPASPTADTAGGPDA